MSLPLWPRTTFGRIALVIAVLLVIAQVAGFVVVRLFFPGPDARQMAVLLDEHISALGTVLDALDAPQREALFARASGAGVRLQGEATAPMGKRPRQFFLRELEDRLQDRLGTEVEMRVQTRGTDMLWVRAPVAGGFWIGVPLQTLRTRLPPLLLISLLLITLLTIGGAYLLVRQINRPLRALGKAARRLGQGSAGETITPGGPEEIRSLAQAFNQSAQALAQLERDRALLLAGISHDLRTPLARLSVTLEMLEGDEDLKDGGREDIEHMDAIIEQFMVLARPAPTEVSVVGDLNEWIRDAVSASERSGLQVQLALGQLPPISFQPLALRRAMSNLLENARRYGRAPVRVESRVVDGEVLVRVADQGDGVPNGELERLLQPFTRLDKARGSPGTGLGLAIVSRVMNAHGGRVELRNRPEGGFEVSLYLPVDNAWEKTGQPLQRSSG
jgi:two-component system osmolarity sensor histidine kinase EnvZ